MKQEKYSYAKMAKSFAYETAMWNVLGAPVRSLDDQDAILETCEKCEYKEKNKCGICQCHIHKGSSKIGWGSTSCPDGRWGPRPDLVDLINTIAVVYKESRERKHVDPPRARTATGKRGCCGGRK